MVESDSEELDWIRSQPREELVSDDPYDFANPSDNLFARLFVNNLNSPGACIPWKYCDLILSTFKDVRFNSRDVTFKSCGDMFCRMGRYRDDTWSMVEARSVMDKTFPQAVLEGVFDVIKMEMQWSVDTERQNSRNNTLRTNRLEEITTGGWRKTLLQMALVHSSWHGYARRLLGFNVISRKGPTPDLLRDPFFGGWTQQLYLSYTSRGQNMHSRYLPIRPNKPQDYFLEVFCTRIPSTRLVSLSLPSIQKLSPTFIGTLCQALSALTSLEDLTIETRHVHPSLRFLRFSFAYAHNGLELVTGRDVVLRLASLPVLHSVHFAHGYSSEGHSPILSRVSWLLISSEPDELCFDCPPEPKQIRDNGVAGDVKFPLNEMLQSARLVEFNMLGRNHQLEDSSVAVPSTIANIVAPILRTCSSSARRLVFRGIPWTRMKLFEQLQMQVPGSVEEVTIVTYLPRCFEFEYIRRASTPAEEHHAETQFALNDVQLSETLALGLAPGLRVLKVRFDEGDEGWLQQSFFDKYICDCESKALEKHYEHVFPHCRQVCIERGIEFYVNITPCPYEYPIF